MAKVSYEKKKKDLASKGMPNPKVGKNVTNGDRKAEMGSSFSRMNLERRKQGHKPIKDRATKGLYDFLDK